MNDERSTNCKFSAEIVPYMYGELADRECSAFESHLLECSACTDEFASISSARYEVYDWKKLEFDPLPTPVIRIPHADDAIVSVGLMDKVRAIFANSWTIPAIGFAGLVVVSIFGASVLLTGDGGQDIASNVKADAPAANQSVPEKAAAIADPVKSDEAGATPRVTRASTTQQPRVEPRRTVHEVKPTRSLEPKSATAQNPKTNAPTLNEFDDEEDNSLRLAELFDDVETSE